MILCDSVEHFQRTFRMLIIQIYKGIIQDQKRFLIAKEGIHKRQTHTQHNAIYCSRTETADFTGGAFFVDMQMQILVDHNIAQLITHQRIGIVLEPALYPSNIAIGKVILGLTQQGKRLIGECAFPFVLFLFILKTRHAVLPSRDIFDRPANTVTLLTQISQFRLDIIKHSLKLLFRFLQNFRVSKIVINVNDIGFNAGIFFQEYIQVALCLAKCLLGSLPAPNIIIGIIDKILGGVVRKLIFLQEVLNLSICLIFPRG